jgi:RND superfamily putative drug exporter
MSKALYRMGKMAASHPVRTIGVWLVIAVAVIGLKGTFGGSPTDNFRIPGVESQRANDLLKERFPSQAGAQGTLVFHVKEGTLTAGPARAGIASTLAATAAAPHVAAVSDPFDARGPTVSADGRTAFARVQYDITHLGKSTYSDVQSAATAARGAGVQVEVDSTIAKAGEKIQGQEKFGLLVAMVVLLVAFGSVIAMGIPIGSALFGIVIGLCGVGLLAGAVDVPTVSPMLAVMIGLGVGIDYALFIVTRHRENMHKGMTPVEAAARANATAGQAVVFAGMTVVVAICGLQLAGLPAVAVMGFSAAIVVAVSVIVAVTLLPALLGLAGLSIDKLRIPHRRPRGDHAETASGRWAHHVGRHPWRYAVISLGLLLALAAPTLGLRMAMADDRSAPPATTEHKAYDLLADGFGKGFTGPLQLVATLPAGADAHVLDTVVAAVSADPDVASVRPAQLNAARDTAVVIVTPKSAPDETETADLVHRLRTTVLPSVTTGTDLSVMVSGQTAALVDLSQRITARLPVFIGAVVLLSFILLLVVFRSVLVPLKAAVMNLLSIGAAYGVIVAVFQWGWGKELFGLHQTIPVNPFVPMIMFAILFGLSMDYEVFLLSRVREEFLRHGDSHRSVVDGLGATARVITSAALIMISVFGAFIGGTDPILKMFGLGLATAVLIDATLVRMVLVPSTMSLLGSANWWLPGWLDRILPHMDLEGAPAETEPEVGPAPEPEPEPELEPAAA